MLNLSENHSQTMKKTNSFNIKNLILTFLIVIVIILLIIHLFMQQFDSKSKNDKLDIRQLELKIQDTLINEQADSIWKDIEFIKD